MSQCTLRTFWIVTLWSDEILSSQLDNGIVCQWTHFNAAHSCHIDYYAPAHAALSDDAVWRLTSVSLRSVAYIRSAGDVCGRPAGWRILIGRPCSRLPQHASVEGLDGGILWRPSAQLVLAAMLSMILPTIVH